MYLFPQLPPKSKFFENNYFNVTEVLVQVQQLHNLK